MSDCLSAEGFAKLCPVSRETLDRLRLYVEVLTRWSARINLVGPETLPDVWRRHILDSAQLLPLLPEPIASLVDLGSGAGLPGLVLAILGVKEVSLIESDSRKCAFLREAARVTSAHVTIHNARIEKVQPRPFDVVTARACAPLTRLLDHAAPFIAANTLCLFLKGEQGAEELTLARKGWTMQASLLESRSDRRGIVLRLQQVARESRDS